MECCGAPFAVGEVVEWTVSSHLDAEWLTAALGAETASALTHSEDHHDEGRQASPTRATVRRITCAYCEYGPHAEAHKALYPVLGTTVLIELTRVDGTESRLSDRVFIGYLIEVGGVA